MITMFDMELFCRRRRSLIINNSDYKYFNIKLLLAAFGIMHYIHDTRLKVSQTENHKNRKYYET